MSAEYGGLGGIAGLAVFLVLCIVVNVVRIRISMRRDHRRALAQRERMLHIYNNNHRPFDWERDL